MKLQQVEVVFDLGASHGSQSLAEHLIAFLLKAGVRGPELVPDTPVPRQRLTGGRAPRAPRPGTPMRLAFVATDLQLGEVLPHLSAVAHAGFVVTPAEADPAEAL